MKGSEIQNIVFSLSVLGYKKSDVRAFLREITEYVLKLEEKIYNLELERDKLKQAINEDKTKQSKLKDILATAQEFKIKMEKEAKMLAGEKINEAKKEYKEIIKIKDEEEAKLKKTIKELYVLMKNIYENLQNYANIIEAKEKKMFKSERSIYKAIEKDEFDIKKMIRIPEEKNEKNEEGETQEFGTNHENNDQRQEENYIKTKFEEIDLR